MGNLSEPTSLGHTLCLPSPQNLPVLYLQVLFRRTTCRGPG